LNSDGRSRSHIQKNPWQQSQGYSKAEAVATTGISLEVIIAQCIIIIIIVVVVSNGGGNIVAFVTLLVTAPEMLLFFPSLKRALTSLRSFLLASAR
jgi:hypothetical protein